VRGALGLTQVKLGGRVGLTGNTVARMERGELGIPPTLELLLGYIAREAGGGVEVAHGQRGRGAAPDKAAHRANARHPVRKGRRGKGR
jgi:transcriptional regulator with XRE-family HTH domain